MTRNDARRPAGWNGRQLHQAVRRRWHVQGHPMPGLFSVGHWSIDFDNPTNRKFVAEFEKEHKRLPTGYAAPMPICRTAGSSSRYFIPKPAFAHCSSWSPVTPLTPTPPVTLPSTMIGSPPGEAYTPGSVAVATPPLLITSANARVGRR